MWNFAELNHHFLQTPIYFPGQLFYVSFLRARDVDQTNDCRGDDILTLDRGAFETARPAHCALQKGLPFI